VISLNHYVILSLVLFCIGIYGVLTRRSIIGILLSLELMFNAVNINLVAFSHFLGNLVGQVLAIFIITVAAAEACVGIALVICIYRNFKEINIDRINLLKW
jgi:NADH:ubiquinone oxidoreductase subunit K